MIDYKTVKRQQTVEFMEKKSKFIANVKPVSEEAEAINFILDVSKQHRTASHNVYAYRLLKGNLSRYSDDGEPAQSAGFPILDMVMKRDIYDIAVVVTRYFGGTLLGKGGLVRAYQTSAWQGIEQSIIIERRAGARLSVSCEYSLYNQIESLIQHFDGKVVESSFLDSVNVVFDILEENKADFFKNLSEKTNGRAIATQTANVYIDKS